MLESTHNVHLEIIIAPSLKEGIKYVGLLMYMYVKAVYEYTPHVHSRKNMIIVPDI